MTAQQTAVSYIIIVYRFLHTSVRIVLMQILLVAFLHKFALHFVRHLNSNEVPVHLLSSF
jgi:hypothetical protein